MRPSGCKFALHSRDGIYLAIHTLHLKEQAFIERCMGRTGNGIPFMINAMQCPAGLAEVQGLWPCWTVQGASQNIDVQSLALDFSVSALLSKIRTAPPGWKFKLAGAWMLGALWGVVGLAGISLSLSLSLCCECFLSQLSIQVLWEAPLCGGSAWWAPSQQLKSMGGQ